MVVADVDLLVFVEVDNDASAFMPPGDEVLLLAVTFSSFTRLHSLFV